MANIQARKSRRNKTVNTTVKKNKRKSQNRHFRKVTVTNPEVAKVWDVKKSLKYNYEKLGLVADPNSGAAKKPKPYSEAVPALPLEEEPVVEMSEPTSLITDLEAKAKLGVRKIRFLADGEVELIRALVAKHATDYKAMARDIKLNSHQHTAKVLQRKCEMYLKEIEDMEKEEAAVMSE